MNVAWAVPRHRRPNPITARGRSLLLVATAGLAVLATTTLAAFAGAVGAGDGAISSPTSLAVTVGAVVVDALILAVVLRIATAAPIAFGVVLPGAVFASIVWQLLQVFGTAYVDGVVRDAGLAYGVFAIVLGLLAWIFLAALGVIVGVEINVVRTKRLYPRALLTPFTDNVDLTSADRRSYTDAAVAQRHKGFEQVVVSFDAPQRSRQQARRPPPHHRGRRRAADRDRPTGNRRGTHRSRHTRPGGRADRRRQGRLTPGADRDGSMALAREAGAIDESRQRSRCGSHLVTGHRRTSSTGRWVSMPSGDPTTRVLSLQTPIIVSAMDTQAESLEAEMLNHPGWISWMVVRRTVFLTSCGACTRTTKLEAMWRACPGPRSTVWLRERESSVGDAVEVASGREPMQEGLIDGGYVREPPHVDVMKP